MKERLSILKTQLIVHHPFFGVLLLNTEMIAEKVYPTAATDGIKIYYNEDFFDKLTDEEAKGILLHECLHIIYFHCDKKRRGQRSPKRWNKSADYAINWEIKDMDPTQITLPKDIMIADKVYNLYYDYKYRNMYVEQIYDLLKDGPEDENGLDEHITIDLDEEQQRALEDKIISSYEIVQNEKGKLSPGIERIVAEIKKVRVPWTRLLHRYIGNAIAKDDYSYTTFNRRFIGQDLYMPGLRSNKVGTIAVVVDTSASIGQNELGAMQNELRKLSGLVSSVIVISCDDCVHSVEIINDMGNFDKAVKSIRGNGATDFKPPFVMLKEKRMMPELVIYMTDGMGSFPSKKDVSFPTIWLMTTQIVAPWGKTIHMKV